MKHQLVIDSEETSHHSFKDLFLYRELFFFLAWKEILVRYRQTFFGIAWALIRPLLNMAIFTFLFSNVAHLPSDYIPYPLFVLAGMLPWQLFASSAIETSSSLIHNAPLISKVYFPRILIPISQMTVNLIDFLVTAILLFLLAVFTESLAGWTLLAMPFFVLLLCAFTIGTGMWLSALSVQYRDVKFIIPFFVQFWMFLSPVGYGTFIVAESWQWLYFLNPMVGIIDGFRWSFFGISHSHLWISVGYSMITISLLLCTGFRYFKKIERVLADKF